MPVEAIAPRTAPSVRINGRNLFEDLRELSDNIARRAFDIFQLRGCENGHDVSDWLLAEREFLLPVPVELRDNDKEFTLTADVKGFNEKELDVQVEGCCVVLKGKHEETKKEEKNKEGKLLREERYADQFLRTIELPSEVAADKVIAELKDGKLKLTLPKVAQASKIEIRKAS